MRRDAAAATTVAALVGVTLAIGLALSAARPAGAFTRPAPPEPLGAFRDGGVPEYDPAIEAPVVLLDQVDAKVAGQLLPVLRGQPYPLGDQDWARSPTGQLIATRAGPAMSLGVVDRTRLAAVLSALGALPTPDLRSAAAATWGDLFGTKLVRLVDAAP